VNWAPNGCSVPRALRLFIPQETPEQTAVCNTHDLMYRNGGTERQRALADAHLLIGLLETGMDVDRAEEYHLAVRWGGKPHWRDGHYIDEDQAIPHP
jgi:hypothetical protein